MDVYNGAWQKIKSYIFTEKTEQKLLEQNQQ